jgi:DNA-binding NarL/FixJ family response regulator
MTPDARSKSSITLDLDGARFSRVIALRSSIAALISPVGSTSAVEDKVLILSAHNDDAYVEKAIALGALGFLLKQTSPNDLPRAIREVQKENTFFDVSITKRLRDRARSQSAPRPQGTTSWALSAHTGAHRQPPKKVPQKQRLFRAVS